MRSVSIRMAFALAGAIIMGMVVFDVGFVFWEQKRYASNRSAEMVRLAQHLAIGLKGVSTLEKYEYDARALRKNVLEQGFLVRYSLGGQVFQWGSFPSSLQCPKRIYSQVRLKKGFEFLCLPFYAGDKQGTIAVARALDETVKHVFEVNRVLFWWLVMAGVVILVLGLFFLRRSIVFPLLRLKQLVVAHDTLGLSTYGQDNTGLLGSLGRGIISMNQQIDDDRARISHQLHELEEAQEQLVRAERLATVGKLAAGLAHEVGNPLAILKGYVDILEDSSLVETERSKALRQMDIELERIHGTLRTLLDYSRVTQGPFEGGHIDQALKHVHGLLMPQKKYKNIQFEFPLYTDERLVALDYDSLVQVLLNLLLNAIEAIEEEGIIRLSFELSNDAVVMWIQDDGPGIEADLVQNVFEPFFTTKEAGHGTGLGLAVCDTMVRAAGGMLTVCGANRPSDALRGACFKLRLPFVDGKGPQESQSNE